MVLPDEIVQAAYEGDCPAIQNWFSTATRDADDLDEEGYSLLHHAALYHHCDTMRIIMEHGASVDAIGGHEKMIVPLHCAAACGKCDAAVLLLDRGAHINARSSDGNTPLILAAGSISAHVDVVRVLLQRGAALDPRDDNGLNAEDHARDEELGRNPVWTHEEAAALLADVRLSGGTWKRYLLFPRKRVLALRVLCEQGRASTDDDLLRRLFPGPAAKVDSQRRTRAAKRGASLSHTLLPKEIFWRVFEYWRSPRDPAP